MKILLASLLTTLTASVAGIVYAGPELGGVFAVVCVVALLAPVFASTPDLRLPPILGVFAGAGIASLLLPIRQSIDGGQFAQLLVLLATFSFALAGVTRLLIAARVSPTLASGVVIALAVAWLGWPIWISPWVTEEHAHLVASIHPLMAANGAIPQYGLWQQSRLMYGLTSLGQDVSVGPPESVTQCAIFHGVIAAIGLIPLVVWSAVRSRRARSAG
jgi:hypothetical protein